jgi:type I restriction enzyme, S subunit
MNGIRNAFLSSLLKSDFFIDYVMKGAKGLKMPRGDISLMKKYSFAVPSPNEQQRIADCLTSLDALIAAQSEKLDALKTHKKGLMQQLFPREGETLPRLRFPEFRDAGKWREKKLGDVGSVRMCKRILKEQTTPHGDIPFFKIGTFGSTPDAYISYELFERYRKNFPFPKNGAILISASGTIGRTVRYKGELAYFQDSNIVWLENSENLIADNFLFYLYQLIDWSPSVGAIQRLYNENILAAKVKFPSIPEQQRVADCLTSLDALITAQTEKLDALKTHKKGLMQQLFPVVEGGRL